MPTYDFGCKDCAHSFSVVKSILMFDSPETCPQCKSLSVERYITCRGGFFNEKDWDSAQYNPGLGTVVKNNKHAEKIAKERGLIAVGNENYDKIATEMAKDREKRQNQAFEEAFAPVQYELTK